MRIIYTLCFLFSIILLGQSQSSQLYTLFVFNKLQYNPAYAGTNEALNIGAHYRHQWQGVNGAPRTLTAFAHTPFAHGRSGVGLSIISHKVGLFNTTKSKIDYAYRIGFKNGKKLSIGLNVLFENTRFNWSSVDLIDATDTSIPFGQASKSAYNVGMGVYYTGQEFYVGASTPTFLRNAITSDTYQGTGGVNDFRPYYLMSGVVFPIGSKIHIRPSLLVTYVKNAPIGADINLSLLFQESFWVGASYRIEESIDAFVQFPLTKQIKLTIAVDYSLTELNQFTKGSGEVMVEYFFFKGEEKVNNIRFF